LLISEVIVSNAGVAALDEPALRVVAAAEMAARAACSDAIADNDDEEGDEEEVPL